MDNKVTVTYRGEKYSYPDGTTLMKVAEDFQKNYDHTIFATTIQTTCL